MKKQPELTALTRKTIIDAYFTLVGKGKKATVSAVTEAAGYNRCTFYRYFTDVDQLLEQVESEICEAFQSALADRPTTASLMEATGSLAAVYDTYGDYLSVLLGPYGDIRFISRMKDMMSPIALRMFAKVESGVALELKTEFMLSGVLAAVTKWYELHRPIPPDEIGKIIQNIFQQVMRKEI